MNIEYRNYIHLSLVVLIFYTFLTCHLATAQSDYIRELKNFNYEVKTESGYEKSLNFPKMTAYLTSSREKIAEIIKDPNNIPLTEQDAISNEKLIQNNTFAFYCNIQNVNKKIVYILLNENEPLYVIGFRYDLIKVKTTTGGYPGRGQFAVNSEEIYPRIQADEIKKKIKGYGYKEFEVVKSNRFLFLFENKKLKKNNTISIYFNDESRVDVFF
ncbi:hypothetical protein [Leptospira stimsonii]|uniref:PepSY domain-containing protein n=1 Tax=Leptospira stimsonii TaxID=2202203 RepID=A0ABY2MUB7_9LEPT|nr:hypothetical protein [Leptospira stimsonii]TGK17623.1 hypothetical protein EHO98_13900 [Leptospira stimsonii]TGM07880.1 hypothetical protein EHQ90_23295 [Leptospira stimsonii]